MTTLNIIADPARWQEALAVTLKEIRRLWRNGATNSELSRFVRLMQADSEQVGDTCSKRRESA